MSVQLKCIPDSECKQGKCACTTTGCWGECNLKRYNIEVHAAPAPQHDADPNAPWLTLAHTICADAGIAPGHITDRLNQLRERIAPAVPKPAVWRCFHCNEVFNDAEQAALHFGTKQQHDPMCQISQEHVRELEAMLERYCEEDTDLHRQLHRMQSDHQIALRREEEKGYARGLADAAPIPPGYQLAPIEPDDTMLDSRFMEFTVSSGLDYRENRRNMWKAMMAVAPQPPTPQGTKYAQLYRKLRAMHWYEGGLTVVMAKDVPLGVMTYSDEMLDEAIAAAKGDSIGND